MGEMERKKYQVSIDHAESTFYSGTALMRQAESKTDIHLQKDIGRGKGGGAKVVPSGEAATRATAAYKSRHSMAPGRRTGVHADPFVVMPSSLKAASWSSVMLACSMPVVFLGVFFNAFFKISSTPPMTLALSVIADVVFTIDIYFRIAHFAMPYKERIVTRRRSFCIIYLCSWGFVIDLLTALPIATLGLTLNDEKLWLSGCWLRTLRLWRVQVYVQGVQSAANGRRGAEKLTMVMRMLAIVFRVLMLSLLLGFVFFKISEWRHTEEVLEGFRGKCSFEMCNDSGVDAPVFCFGDDDILEDFVTAWYFMVQTLFTVGYGDILPVGTVEVLYVCVMVTVGVLFHAYIIANMTSMLKNMDITAARFKQNMDQVNAFMRVRRLSPELRARITEYFDFLWSRQKGRLEHRLLAELPYVLRAELSNAKRRTLLKVPLFQGREEAFVDAVVTLLERMVISTGDILVVEGESATCMWFLSDGKLSVLRSGSNIDPGTHSCPADAAVIHEIVPGDEGFYGERMLCSSECHPYTICAATVCELQRLKKEALEKLIAKSAYMLNSARVIGALPQVGDGVGSNRSKARTMLINASGTRKNTFSIKAAQNAANGQVGPGQRVSVLATRPALRLTMASGVGGLRTLGERSARGSVSSRPEGGTMRRTRRSVQNSGKAGTPPVPAIIDAAEIGAEQAQKHGDLGVRLSYISSVRRLEQLRGFEAENRMVRFGSFGRLIAAGGSEIGSGRRMLLLVRRFFVQHAALRLFWDVFVFLIACYGVAVIPIRLALGDHLPTYKIQNSTFSNSMVDLDGLSPGVPFLQASHTVVFETAFDLITLLDALIIPPIGEGGGDTSSRLGSAPSIEWSRSGLESLVNAALLVSSLLGLALFFADEDVAWHWSRLPFLACYFSLLMGSSLLRMLQHLQRLSGIPLNTMYTLALRITVGLLSGLHIFTCAWWDIYHIPSADESEEWATSDLQSHSQILDSCSDPALALNGIKYIESLYFALVTMSTVGFGDVTPKGWIARFYAIIVIIIGATIYAMFVSILAAISHRVEVNEQSIEHIGNCLRVYLLDREISAKVTAQCIAFLEYEVSKHRVVNENTVLEHLLPDSLRTEVVGELAGERLNVRRCALFRPNPDKTVICPDEMIHTMIRSLQRLTFCPEDMIVSSKSGLKRAMVFLEAGAAEVLSADNQVLTRLKEGEAFGELELFAPDEQTLQLRAVEFCELWVLMKHDMDFALTELVENAEMSEDLSELERAEAVAENLLERAREIYAKSSGGNIAKNLGNKKLEKMLQQETEDKVTRKMFAPDSHVQGVWNIVVLFFVLFSVIELPRQLCFDRGPAIEQNVLTLVIMYLGDLVFIVDIFLRWRHFGVELGASVEMDPHQVAKLYTRGPLLVDVLALLPLGWIALSSIATGNTDGDLGTMATDGTTPFIASVQAWAILRAPRILRMFRSRQHVNMLGHYLPVAPNIFKIALLLTIILLCAHLGGCLFFGIARLEAPGGVWCEGRSGDAYADAELCKVWTATSSSAGKPLMQAYTYNATTGDKVELERFVEGLGVTMGSTSESYSWSLYWAVTVLTTVGYGDYHVVTEQPSEMVFTIILLIIGGAIYAAILANLEEIVAQSDISSILFQRKMDEVNEYLAYRKLPRDLSQRILTYYNKLWTRQKGVEEAWLLNHLPLSLQRAVKLERARMSALKKIPFFYEWGEVNSLLDMLQPMTYLEGNVIFLKDELVQQMYCLLSGKVEYVSPDGSQVFTSFIQGDVLNASAFFFNEPTPCAARVVTACDALVLHREDFENFLHLNPKLYARFAVDLAMKEVELRKHGSLQAFMKNIGKGKIGKIFHVVKDRRQSWMDNPEGFVFPPDHIFRRIWDVVVLITIIYNLISVPLRTCFYSSVEYCPIPATALVEPRNETALREYEAVRDSATFAGRTYGAFYEEPFLLLDVVFDLVLWTNIALKLRRFARIHNGVMLRRRSAIMRAYMSSGTMALDVIAILPLDFALLAASDFNAAALAGVRLLRLLYVYQISSLLSSIEFFLQEHQVRFKAGVITLNKMFFFVLVGAHIVACARASIMDTDLPEMYGKNRMACEDIERHWDNGTVVAGQFHESLPSVDPFLNMRYLMSLYWALYSITTVGFGNVPVDTPEFAIVVMLIGAFLCDAGLTATLTNMQTNHDAKLGNSRRRKDSVTTYMKSHHIEQETQERVLQFLNFKTVSQHDLDESRILAIDRMPVHFRIEVVCFTALEIVPHLSDHPLFNGFSEGMMQSVASLLEPVVMPAQQDLIRDERENRNKSMLDFQRSSVVGEKSSTFGGSSSNHVIPGQVNDSSGYLHAQEEYIYFLVRGKVIVIPRKGKPKLVRRGIISPSTGLLTARTVSVCELFALSISAYEMLAPFSAVLGGVFHGLEELLLDEDGFDSMKRFAASQYAEENLDFWKTTNEFASISRKDSGKLQAEATRIFEHFIAESALKMINIDAHTREDLVERIKCVDSADVFDQARKVIFEGIKVDLLPRFIRSDGFSDLVKRKKEKMQETATSFLRRQVGLKNKSDAAMKRKMSVGEDVEDLDEAVRSGTINGTLLDGSTVSTSQQSQGPELGAKKEASAPKLHSAWASMGGSGFSSREAITQALKSGKARTETKNSPSKETNSGVNDRSPATDTRHRQHRQSIGSRLKESIDSRRRSIALLREDAINNAFDEEVKITSPVEQENLLSSEAMLRLSYDVRSSGTDSSGEDVIATDASRRVRRLSNDSSEGTAVS